MLAWLDDAHAGFASAVDALEDDAELAVERMVHWGRPLPTNQIISIVITTTSTTPARSTGSARSFAARTAGNQPLTSGSANATGCRAVG